MTIFNHETALKYCQDEAVRRDIGVYLHSTFIPDVIKPYFFTVHALRLELLKARETIQHSTLVSSKHNWWKDALQTAWEGHPIQEPTSIAIYQLRNNASVRRSHFERMVNGRFNEQEIRTWGSFDRFIDDNYTMCFYLTLELLQLYGETEFMAATFAGRAWGISKLLLMTKFYLDRGRCYFPEEILKRYRVPEALTIEDPETHENQVPEQFFDVLLEVSAYGKKNLEKAREYTNDLPPNSYLAFLPVAEAELFYNQLEYNNFNIFASSSTRMPWTRIFLKMVKHARRGIF